MEGLDYFWKSFEGFYYLWRGLKSFYYPRSKGVYYFNTHNYFFFQLQLANYI